MSAFVVSDATINTVISFLNLKLASDSHYGPAKLLLADGYDLDTEEGCSLLGNAFFKLNCDAVDQRYGQDRAAKFRPLDYKYVFCTPPNIFQVYENLCCLIYQCSEGYVIYSPLYRLLTRLRDSLAREIIRDLPAYRATTWGQD